MDRDTVGECVRLSSGRVGEACHRDCRIGGISEEAWPLLRQPGCLESLPAPTPPRPQRPEFQTLFRDLPKEEFLQTTLRPLPNFKLPSSCLPPFTEETRQAKLIYPGKICVVVVVVIGNEEGN